MTRNHALLALSLLFFSGSCWAYGSSSSKACSKPKFSDFVPAENAEVAAGTNFSFTASANTNPNSIKVTLKGAPVNVTIHPKKNGSLEVSGKLPAEVTGTFARIGITADAPNDCNASGGWLVKVVK